MILLSILSWFYWRLCELMLLLFSCFLVISMIWGVRLLLCSCYSVLKSLHKAEMILIVNLFREAIFYLYHLDLKVSLISKFFNKGHFWPLLGLFITKLFARSISTNIWRSIAHFNILMTRHVFLSGLSQHTGGSPCFVSTLSHLTIYKTGEDYHGSNRFLTQWPVDEK